MKSVRDLVVTAVLLLVFLGVLAAIPFVIFFVVILGVAWLIYAGVHDSRIAAERRAKEIKDNDNTFQKGNGSSEDRYGD
jgi:threonine/homoserine/homoserine lactone efflux protein